MLREKERLQVQREGRKRGKNMTFNGETVKRKEDERKKEVPLGFIVSRVVFIPS